MASFLAYGSGKTVKDGVRGTEGTLPIWSLPPRSTLGAGRRGLAARSIGRVFFSALSGDPGPA